MDDFENAHGHVAPWNVVLRQRHAICPQNTNDHVVPTMFTTLHRYQGLLGYVSFQPTNE
jgi:hypothetical protein